MCYDTWPEWTGSDGNKGVFHIPQSSSITGTSPSDGLMLYQGQSFGEESYLSAEVQSVCSADLADKAKMKLKEP